MKTHILFTIIIGSLLINPSTQYRQYLIDTTEDDDLCSPIIRRKIILGKDSNSGLIVKQKRLNDHSHPWRYDFKCKFKVATQQYDGLIAVIQHVSFRKNETSDECIDYVQFKSKNGATSKQFCGTFNAALQMDPIFLNPGAGGISNGNSFLDVNAEMEVSIFVSKEPLRLEEELDIFIAFTAYKDCFEMSKRRKEDDLDDYKPCSSNYDKYCIYKDFFQDGIVNCPFANCVDEFACSEDPTKDQPAKTSLGNKVLIGSISSLFIVFIIFIICLWICRAYKALCWSENWANPNRERSRTHTPPPPTAPPPSSARVIEMSEPTGIRRLERPQGNTTSANVVDPDKDMPPSYDSLFPDR